MYRFTESHIKELLTDHKILVFEGPDGVGKTFHVNKIKEYAAEHGINVIQVRCPDNRGDAHIRACIMGETIAKNPMAQAFLFMADFLLAYESVIKPALSDPTVRFIFDRFMPSTCMYQGLALEYINQVFEAGYPEFAKVFSEASYLYLIPGDMTEHKQRLAQKQGDEINHLDPTTDEQITSQIKRYDDFAKKHRNIGLIGSYRVERVIV